MIKGKSKMMVEHFVDEKDCHTLIKYWKDHSHLCTDDVDQHKHRNLHWSDIKSRAIKKIITYYMEKNCFFVSHFFHTRVKLYSAARLVGWKTGEEMDFHIDRDVEQNRTMDYSSLIYLNDEYVGGSIEFPNTERYTPRAGCNILFHAGAQNAHKVNKITKGKRYTIPSWYKTI